MPGLELRQSLNLRLEQRIVLQLSMTPGDFGAEPFTTEGEIGQVSEQEIIKSLQKRIEAGEYFDQQHFGMEINRAVYCHPLEARLGDFAQSISGLLKAYESDEKLSSRILSLLGSQEDTRDIKNLPGEVARSWGKASEFFPDEPTELQVLKFLEDMAEREVDLANTLNFLTASEDGELLKSSMGKITDYARTDKRLIPFTDKVLSPLLRKLKREQLSPELTPALYTDVVEPLYMIDRELQNPQTAQRIRDYIKENGLEWITADPLLPAPIRVYVEGTGQATQAAVRARCDDSDFKAGREIKRDIYKGLAALDRMHKGEDILRHIAEHTSGSRGFKRLLGKVNLVSKEPDFQYPFQLEEEYAIHRNLELQLVDKSVKRLKLSPDTLERYLDKIQSDERFARIGQIATTLASYSHYQSTHQIDLIREIVEAELDDNFSNWRYTHDKAEAQLTSLGGANLAWSNKTRISRVVGKLNGLKSHVDSVKKVLPKIKEVYQDYYKSEFSQDKIPGLEKEIGTNEKELRSSELGKKAKKKLGFDTFQLREHLSYLNLITGVEELTTDNYQQVLEQAEEVVKRKSRNPLYDSASWIQDTLDQPVYREARRIVVYQTDDLEELLRFGERPVPHCQNWRNNSSYNKSLLSFVADANKEIDFIANGDEKPFGMSMKRLVGWEDSATILFENIYSNEWSDDYGVALLGSAADKAVDILKQGEVNEVRIAVPYDSGCDVHDTNVQLLPALEKFGEKYRVEIHEGPYL